MGNHLPRFGEVQYDAVDVGRIDALVTVTNLHVVTLERFLAEARASGLPVTWEPVGRDDPAQAGTGFRFTGLPRRLNFPQRWLDEEVRAEVAGARAVSLGPEPLIGAQRIVLRLAGQQLVLATDGLAPFAVASAGTAGAPTP